jgi:hypothetical protein
MAEDNDAGIHIGQLNLRMPGHGAERAHRVAHGIGELLGRKVPADQHRRLGALSLRVHVGADATEADMSDAIAGAIANVLRKGETRR